MSYRHIATHLLALYIGAGLFGGIIMSRVLPLTGVGIAYYAATWPQQVYCAAPERGCFAQSDYLPIWFQKLMFDPEAYQ